MANKKQNDKRELVIPSNSVLRSVIGAGKEGMCFGCGKAIGVHYGHRGVWKGCPNPLVPANATFALVPLIMGPTGVVADVPRVPTMPAPTEHKTAVAHERSTSRPAGLTPRFAYTVKDRRRHPKDVTPALQDAYKGLLKVDKPVTAQQAAKLAKRPQEANRRSLNQLVEQGLVQKVEAA